MTSPSKDCTRHRASVRTFAAPAALIVLALCFTGGREAAARRGEASLTLRANPAIAAPGGVFAVVLRTYAPRPIRQGQVSVRVAPRPAPQAAVFGALPAVQPKTPVATLLSATVYSVRGDAVSQMSSTIDAQGQRFTVQFQSPSAGVNAADGPLAVLRFRLSSAVAPGQQLDLQIDGITSMIDAGGRAVVLDPRPGLLTVRAANAPFAVEAEGDEVAPGSLAELGVQTFEPFPVSGGRVTLRYDPRLAGGDPVVRMDQRYGASTFTVDRRQSGVLVVNFQSANATLNTVPGTIVAVDLPISAGAAIGSSSAVTLDPAQTWLLSRRGRRLAVRLQNGSLTIQ